MESEEEGGSEGEGKREREKKSEEELGESYKRRNRNWREWGGGRRMSGRWGKVEESQGERQGGEGKA